LALLPIALYLRNQNKKNFVDSTQQSDAQNQLVIQRWIAIVLLRNVFGAASDRRLKNLQDVLNEHRDSAAFPYEAVNRKLGIEPNFSDTEIASLLATPYSSKYSYLILSLLYPDRDWREKTYEEDHIYPKSAFTTNALIARGYAADVVESYQKHFNTVVNLQLLTDKENREKSAAPFDGWLQSRDAQFKSRHAIPDMDSYGFDQFLEFVDKRRTAISEHLKSISM
jgi:hypothetical protein